MESTRWSLHGGVYTVESTWWSLHGGVYLVESARGVCMVESARWSLERYVVNGVYSMECTWWSVLYSVECTFFFLFPPSSFTSICNPLGYDRLGSLRILCNRVFTP